MKTIPISVECDESKMAPIPVPVVNASSGSSSFEWLRYNDTTDLLVTWSPVRHFAYKRRIKKRNGFMNWEVRAHESCRHIYPLIERFVNEVAADEVAHTIAKRAIKIK
jgi:hypothetical protein